MLIREITESKERLDEIAFMALLPLASKLATLGLVLWTAWDIYQAIMRYVNAGGSLTDYNRLIEEVGPEAARAIRDFVVFYGITKVAAMSWNVFRRTWRQAKINAAKTGGAVAADQGLDAAGIGDDEMSMNLSP